MSVVFIIFKCFYSTFRLMLKDTILCPWNNLHWVVGRAVSYWLRLTLVSAHSKIENRLTGAPERLEQNLR